jgi:hypothetical protein
VREGHGLGQCSEMSPDGTSSRTALVSCSMLRCAVAGTLAALAVAGCAGEDDDKQSARATTSATTRPAERGVSSEPEVAARAIEECPQLPERCAAVTEWVSRVLGRADYRVTGDTGSALITAGSGNQSLYVWATSVKGGVPRERQRWPKLGAVARVRLYGREQRRWWVTQGFVFGIEAGPFQHSTLPGRDRLARLVRASYALEPPKTQRRG